MSSPAAALLALPREAGGGWGGRRCRVGSCRPCALTFRTMFWPSSMRTALPAGEAPRDASGLMSMERGAWLGDRSDEGLRGRPVVGGDVMAPSGGI